MVEELVLIGIAGIMMAMGQSTFWWWLGWWSVFVSAIVGAMCGAFTAHVLIRRIDRG
jgi:phosphate/sulfate permease